MRIRSFTVKNFKSISSIEDFQILDTGITCLIGKNGSGKSNILQALSALKNDSLLIDENIHIGSSDEPSIEIIACLEVDETDHKYFSEIGLDHIKPQMIRVLRRKTIGAAIEEDFSVVEGDASNATTSKKIAKDLSQKINAMTMDENKKIKLIEQLSSLHEQERPPEVLDIVQNSLQGLGFDLAQDGVADTISSLRTHFAPIGEKIKALFEKVDIQRLALNEYLLEDSAPIDQLTDRSQHEFIHDLIQLTGKTVDDLHNAEGNKKINTFEEASETLNKELRRVWGAHPLKLIIQKDNADNEISICFRTAQGKAVKLRDLSDGEQWFLKFYTRLSVAQKEKRSIIWLFDEPGQELHAGSQLNMRDLFEDRAKDTQIIYTTHQPLLSQWQRLERIFVAENCDGKSSNDLSGTILHKRFWKDADAESPLKEIWSLFVGEDMLTGKGHLVVEGMSDYFLLLGWAHYFYKNGANEEIELVKEFLDGTRSIVPSDGKDKIPMYLYFLTRKLKNKVDWVVITDSKKDMEDLEKTVRSISVSLEGYLTKRSTSIEDSFKRYKTLTILDIEDLFDPEEYIKEFNEYYSHNWSEIKLPDNYNYDKKGNIAKKLWAVVKDNNENLAKEIGVDKPGIALQIYLKLVKGENTYSADARKRFLQLLAGANKLFESKISEN